MRLLLRISFTMKTSKKIKATAYLLISSVIIGFSFVVLKTGLGYASPLTILIDRLLIAALVIFLLKKAGIITIDKISFLQKVRLFFLSQLYPIAFFLFQNFGIKHITVSETSIIYSLVPVFTTIASAIILKEKTSLLQKFGILLSFGGMGYIFFHSFNGVSDSLTGYAMIFCSLLSMVLFYVFLKKSVAKISPVSITYYLLLFAASSYFAVYMLWIFINSQIFLELNRLENYNYVMTILYLGVLSTFGTSMLTTVGIKYLSAGQTSIFSNISPFFGILAGVLLMNDVLKTYQVIGAVCVFAGMFISLK